ncbi:hypothetical protein VaNZ11_002695, partial [Volvox africanus]
MGGKSAPQPKSQSAQLPIPKPSMPYSNAGVGIRENVRSGPLQRNKPVDAGLAHSAQHCSNASTARAAAAAAAPDGDDDDNDDDMPMLLDSDDDELDVYGTGSSGARQACTRNMDATPARAAAAQPGLASSRVSASEAAPRSAPPAAEVPPAAQQ